MSTNTYIVSTSDSSSLEQIKNFLGNRHSGVLGTADAAAMPHTAVVYYTLEDDFCLVFATKTETQKAKNILENPHVAFAVYDEVDQTTVQITGRAVLIEDEPTKDKVVSAMFENSSNISKREFAPADKLMAGETLAFRIIPLSVRMGVFSRPVSSEEEYYETVLFS